MDSDTAIQRPCFFPYAVTPFLGGALFHLLLCNGCCLFLLMGIFQKLIQPHTSPVDIALFSDVEAILRG